MLRAVALAARLDVHDRPRHRGGDPRRCAERSCKSSPHVSSRSSTRSCARAARRTFVELHGPASSPTCFPRRRRRSRGANGPAREPRAARPPPRPRRPGRGPHQPPSRGHPAPAPGRPAAARGRGRVRSADRWRKRRSPRASRWTLRPRPLPWAPTRTTRAAVGPAAAEPDDRQPRVNLPLSLPYARRDLDRLRVIRLAQRRLTEIHRSPEVKQVLGGRPYLDEALRFMEIHGGPAAPALVAHWRGLDMSDVPVSPRVSPPRTWGGVEGDPARDHRGPFSRHPACGPGGRAGRFAAGPSGPRRRRRRRRRRPPTPAPRPDQHYVSSNQRVPGKR